MKKLLIIFGASLSLSMVSCVGGGGVVTPSSAPQVVSTFKTLMAQLPQGNTTGTLPGDLGGGGVTTSSIESKDISRLACDTVTPASPTDADSDGIALTKDYKFDCTESNNGTSEFNRLGSFRITDLDDTVKGITGGYKFEFDISKWLVKTLATGMTMGGTYKGFWKGTGTGTTSHYESDYMGSFYGEFDMSSHGLGIVKVDYTFSHLFDIKYTHDDVASGVAWTSGTMEGTGSYSFAGNFLSESHNGDHSVKEGSAKMLWKTENVTFDKNCSKWYKTGAFYLTDVGGNVIKTAFNCTEVKVYMNGTELTDAQW